MRDPEQEKAIREKQRYLEISGTDEHRRPKAHVLFTYYEQYSDGTRKVLQELTISIKPIVTVFRHAGYVNVLLNFKSKNDADLAMAWNLLQSYAQPINSIDWTEEELESGIYKDEKGESRNIWFPGLELALSPVKRETEFMLLGFNPAFFTLAPEGPQGQPCVLQLTFNEDFFLVSEQEPYSAEEIDQIRKEAREEVDMELAGHPASD